MYSSSTTSHSTASSFLLLLTFSLLWLSAFPYSVSPKYCNSFFSSCWKIHAIDKTSVVLYIACICLHFFILTDCLRTAIHIASNAPFTSSHNKPWRTLYPYLLKKLLLLLFCFWYAVQHAMKSASFIYIKNQLPHLQKNLGSFQFFLCIPHLKTACTSFLSK